MKQLFLSIFFLAFALSSIGQSTVQEKQQDYLRKSKSQNVIASCLAAGGGIMLIAGICVYPKDYNFFWGGTPEQKGRVNTASALILSGGAFMVASIPIFASSGTNKKRAAAATSLHFKMDSRSMIRQQTLVQASYPSLSLKISL